MSFLRPKSNFQHLNLIIWGLYSWLTNWLRVRNSVKTVKFRSWKFHLQKLKMGQRFGQYDFIILFGILTSSTPIWIHTITIKLTNWFLGKNFILSVKFVFRKFHMWKWDRLLKIQLFGLSSFLLWASLV